jgi:hypothetical protein
LTIKEALTGAAALVRRGWTQGAWARTLNGESIGLFDACACLFCARGALTCVATTCVATIDLLQTIYNSPSWPRVDSGRLPIGIVTWNDTPGRTAEEVATMLEKVAGEQP